MIASFLLLVVLQDMPTPRPALCRVAGLRVEQLNLSVQLYTPRYATEADAAAARRRRQDLDGLAKSLKARFGGAKLTLDDLHALDSLGNEDMLAFAGACLNLPK